jgi:hypothetical protein
VQVGVTLTLGAQVILPEGILLGWAFWARVKLSSYQGLAFGVCE